MRNIFDSVVSFWGEIGILFVAFFTLLFNKAERRQYDWENGYSEDID